MNPKPRGYWTQTFAHIMAQRLFEGFWGSCLCGYRGGKKFQHMAILLLGGDVFFGYCRLHVVVQ